MSLELTKNTDLCLEISPELLDRAWQYSQSYVRPSSRWRAYLNLICVNTFLPWLQDKYGDRVGLWQDEEFRYQLWEFFNGTAILFDDLRLIAIPSDDIDADELRVPQEWIDIPIWLGDYYLAIQIDIEQGLLRVWGYGTHQKLKEEGNYSRRDRAYCLDREDLIEDLNVLWVSHQFDVEETTRSEVESITVLSLDRANELLELLGNPETAFPRRLIAFSEWGALIANDNLRRNLYQRRHSPAEISPQKTNLRQWLQGVFEAGWQAAEELVDPQLLLGFRPIEIRQGKLIDLGIDLNQQQIVLIIRLTPVNEEEVRIQAQISPKSAIEYLPENLKLTILDEDRNVFQEIIARTNDRLIQYQFEGNAGERFAIEIALEDTRIVREFVI